MRIVRNVRSLERLGVLEGNTRERPRPLVPRGHEVHVLHGAPVADGAVPSTRGDFEAAGAVLHGPFPFSSTVLAAPLRVPRFLPGARLVRSLRPDVLWLQHTEQVIWGQTVSWVAGVPLVCHVHHLVNYGWALPYITRGVRRFITVSEFTRDRWVEGGIAGNRVDVVHNAVPPETYPPGGDAESRRARAALGLPADVPTALYYGRMTEGKGLGVVLDAWDRLAPDPGAAHLVLAGDFAAADDPWRSRVDRAVASGTVTSLPAQRDVVPLLHAADLVLFPSQLQESFGRVALEALVTHRPVLASAIGGVPEILRGPLEELLVPPGDAAALATGIEALLRWRQDRPGLGALCGAEAERRFSFPAYVESLEASLTAAVRRTGR